MDECILPLNTTCPKTPTGERTGSRKDLAIHGGNLGRMSCCRVSDAVSGAPSRIQEFQAPSFHSQRSQHHLLSLHEPLQSLTFKFKGAKGSEGKSNAAHITGLREGGEARGSQLVGQALGHAWVPEGLVHKDQGQHLQEPVLDVLLQLRNLTAQVVQHSCEGRAEGEDTGHTWGCTHDIQSVLGKKLSSLSSKGIGPHRCLVFKVEGIL